MSTHYPSICQLIMEDAFQNIFEEGKRLVKEGNNHFAPDLFELIDESGKVNRASNLEIKATYYALNIIDIALNGNIWDVYTGNIGFIINKKIRMPIFQDILEISFARNYLSEKIAAQTNNQVKVTSR